MIKIIDVNKIDSSLLFKRTRISSSQVTDAVSGIIKDVQQNGDEALKRCSLEFDGFCPDVFELPAARLQEAADRVPDEFLSVLNQAAERIRRYHVEQLRQDFSISENGTVLMQKIRPLQRVGIYVPGGTAAYPSTVLMNAIPAKIAGVEEIIMASPPTDNGEISPVILAAAHIAGVDRVFQIGGAQAIAAMAFGTESVPATDKICGPGNAYVAEAKRQVFGIVGIDMVAGPSEILVIADDSCEPSVVAADMLSQAEHDKNASAVLITTSTRLAYETASELEKQLEALPRKEIARASIENNAYVLICDSVEAAIETANELAPEHLELCVDNPFDYVDLIKNAGSVFLGKNCPEALGDYFAGTNHTLPTSGTARYASPLSVDDFIKKTSFTYYTADALDEVKDSVALFARKENLEGHARSVLSRSKNSFRLCPQPQH